ncbi:MAG: hypothetical protein NT076_02920 [Candidatus Pacearchaeota archaeon]|nr:hypothetical protein [Candidatus Pacearchaeota archaeon]
MTRSVFWLDRTAEIIRDDMLDACSREGIDIDLETSTEASLEKIPRGKHVYILHLSSIDEADLLRLRNEQPWSYVVGLSRRGNAPLPVDLFELIDKNLFVVGFDNLKEILTEYEGLGKQT